MVFRPEIDAAVEREEVAYEYADLVYKMIDLRTSLDSYLEKNENPTYRQEVQIEVEDQIKQLCEHADFLLVFMEALDEGSPD